MSSVWRVHIEGTDINDFISKHQLEPSGSRTDSFNLLISDYEDLAEQKEDILHFFREDHSLIKEVSDLGGSSQIDIALYVGSEGQFTQSINFSKDELAAFTNANVELCISAYPCCDE